MDLDDIISMYGRMWLPKPVLYVVCGLSSALGSGFEGL